MLARLLARLGAALDREAIPYTIIGGQAALLCGEPRMTRDIDVTVALGIEEVDRLLAVLRALHLDPLPRNILSLGQETMVLPSVERASGIRVDFILSFTPHESAAIARAWGLEIEGQEVRFRSNGGLHADLPANA